MKGDGAFDGLRPVELGAENGEPHDVWAEAVWLARAVVVSWLLVNWLF
jgi:hypothetical protein